MVLFVCISRDCREKTRLDFSAIALVNGKLTVNNPHGGESISQDY